jgi:PiT family inorganic phosphate transporter
LLFGLSGVVNLDGGLAAAGAIGLAALLGTSDAANSTAALVSARAGTYRSIGAWSVGWHLVGGIVAGTAVARTVVGIVHVRPILAAATYAAACLSSVAFTTLTTRRGLPTSASVGLVGGLAGAGVMAGGWHAVDWGRFDGLRLVGVVGVLLGIVIAPLVGALATAAVARSLRRPGYRLRRTALGPLHGGIWLASAAVGLADGTNDGQKAMGILAVALTGGAVLGGRGLQISWTVRILCAAVLAAGTVVGGRRIVATVSGGLSTTSSVEDLAAQGTSAGVIFLGAVAGLPLSTSTVVTSAMVGSGLVGRRRHVRWEGVLRVLAVWVVTLPACGALGAALYELIRLVGR